MIQKGEKTLQRWDLKAFTRWNEGEDVSQQALLQGTVIPVQTTPPMTVKRDFTERKRFYSVENQFLKLNLRS